MVIAVFTKKLSERRGTQKGCQRTMDKNTKMAMLMYDAQKTSQAEILKRIALAGYDSGNFLAPDKADKQLQECCQYDRVKN